MMRSLLLAALHGATSLSVPDIKPKEGLGPPKFRKPFRMRQGLKSDMFLSTKEQKQLNEAPKPLTRWQRRQAGITTVAQEQKLAREQHDVQRVLPFKSLTEVLHTVREALPKSFANGQPSSIVNVGASYKDVDPIYNLNLTETHPEGYTLLGYECDTNRVPILAKHRPDVHIREMCVTGPSIVTDLHEMQVEDRFSLLKTDIDSVDGPVLDSILREFRPYVVYSEIMWDFAPPVEFSLVKVEDRNFNPFTGGCFGMSITMADHILRRNGYRLIEAAHANIMAVHEDVAHLFEDRPQDPWFWFQFVKSGFYHSHWLGGGVVNASENTPLAMYEGGLGLYAEVERTDGRDNFGKPPVGIRTMDAAMSRIAERIETGCKISGKVKYMLAVGDRCCAPQWGAMENCVCEFPEEAVDTRTRAT